MPPCPWAVNGGGRRGVVVVVVVVMCVCVGGGVVNRLSAAPTNVLADLLKFPFKPDA